MRLKTIAAGTAAFLALSAAASADSGHGGHGGKGHVRFFVDKLDWLYWRYMALMGELRRRGYDPKNKWPSDIIDVPYVLLWCSWKPDQEAIELNRKRIKERMPKRPRYAGRYVTM